MSAPPATRGLGRTRPSEGDGALAGVVAAAAALAAGELPPAFVREPVSPVTAVSNEFVDRFAGSLKDLAVALFGRNDKAALVVGVIATSLALGAVLGAAAVRRWPIAVAGFGAFGAAGLWSSVTDPRSDGALPHVLAAVAGVGAGIAALWWLLQRAGAGTGRTTNRSGRGLSDPDNGPSSRRRRSTPGSRSGAHLSGPELDVSGVSGSPDHGTDRRSFLAWSAGLAVAAATAGALGPALRNRASVAAERLALRLPAPVRRARVPRSGLVEVDRVSPYITPNADFYRIDTALLTPQVSVDSWRLAVTGLVDEPYELTFDELAAMDVVEEVVTLACVSNEVGGDLVGNARWLGVPLADVLDRAGVRPEATQIVGRSVDGFTVGFPTDVGLDGRVALVAIGMNGEPLPALHGYPARLVVAGLYGYVSATKWLSEIELTRLEDFDAYWVPRGWSKEAPIKTQSRIDVPRPGVTVSPGEAVAAGVAWAPGTGIRAVEVQVDDGPWEPAELGATAGPTTWVQWVHRWNARPGERSLRVRATDATGATQTPDRAPPAPDGATGHHEVTVSVAG